MRLPLFGDTFEGRYEIVEVLGEGGFATVYRARDPLTSRDVVLKILSPRGGAYPENVAARFQREARIFATLQNPHTITMFDFGESADGLLFMVFEFIHGRELGLILFENGPFDSNEVIHILRQVLSALAEAHAVNILHRDIKPANILLFPWSGDPNRVKLIDFGIAKDMRENATKITQTGRIIGTLRYMAPEQVFGEPLGPTTDIFSLGLVACEMLTGVPVVAGESQREMLEVQTAADPLHVPENVGTPALRAVINRMMGREPKDRYASAADAIAALTDAQSNPLGRTAAPVALPVAAPNPSPAPTTSTTNEHRSYDWRMVAGISALATLAVVGFVATLLTPEPTAPPRADALKALTTTRPAPSVPTSKQVEAAAATSGAIDAEPPVELRVLGSEFGSPVAVFIPAQHDRPMPVVMMFHRRMRNGMEAIEASELVPLAQEHGFIIAAPNAPDGLNWPEDRLDIAYRALNLVREHAEVDLRRWMVIGDEHAVRFSSDVTCAVPVSAAVGAFAGDSRGCKPVAATPRLRLYGLRDPQTPPAGGFGCNLITGEHPPAETIENKWRKRYACSKKSSPWGEFQGGTCQRFHCKRAPLVICAMDSGHMWPGADGQFLPIGLCPDVRSEHPFPMAQAIWTFFEEEGHVLTDAELEKLEAELAGH